MSEAVTNSIVHAYPDTLGRIMLRARLFDDNSIEITVRDWGCGIDDISQARSPMYTTGGDDRSGMGLHDHGKLYGQPARALEARSRHNRCDAPEDFHARQLEIMEKEALERLLSAKNGDREAADEMVSTNSGLIWSIARRYFGRGVDPDDLYQLGCVGFLKAVEGFDPAFGTQFSTYAVPKIAGEIRRFLRDDGSIKVSRSIKERAHAIRGAKSALEQRLGREPRHFQKFRKKPVLQPRISPLPKQPPARLNPCSAKRARTGLLLKAYWATGFRRKTSLSRCRCAKR